MDPEAFYRQQLADLLREYQERAKPIIDKLVELESLKPPKPVYITREQAEAWGFTITTKGE